MADYDPAAVMLARPYAERLWRLADVYGDRQISGGTWHNYARLAEALPSPCAKSIAERLRDWPQESLELVKKGDFTSKESMQVMRNTLPDLLLGIATNGAPVEAVTGVVANMALLACFPELSRGRTGEACRRSIFGFEPLGADA